MLRWKSLCIYLIAGVVIASSTGCSAIIGIRDYIAYNDATNDFVIGWRNDVWAWQSWHENKAQFVDQAYLRDFGTGYRDGYRAVASGGDGCPPPVPPRCYWTWHYQTPEGQAKMAAWASGYPYGAAAAERDKAGEWMEIPVSQNVRTQYSPEFQNGTIFLPEEMRSQLPAHLRQAPAGTQGPGMEGLPPLEPQADPAFQPAPGASTFVPPGYGPPAAWPHQPPAGVSMEGAPGYPYPHPAPAQPVPPPNDWLRRMPPPDTANMAPAGLQPGLASNFPSSYR